MKKLQDFRFNKSRYERPSQKKVCGMSIYGKPCQMGPDAQGKCNGQYECIPSKKGDRWNCARSGESGDKCDLGPHPDGTCRNKIPPCVPVDTTRSRRGRTVYWASAFSVLFLLLFAAGSLQSNFINPGELTSKHSFDGQQCSNCHGDSSSNAGSWLKRAFGGQTVEHNNQGCLDCHAITDNAQLAHNVSTETLAQKTGQLNKLQQQSTESFSLISMLGLQQKHVPDEQLECVSCHSEHKGKAFNLTSINNNRCESCHAIKHPDFAEQHPPFTAYPYKRRTRLVFDHTGHIDEYFKKEKYRNDAPWDCESCHSLDDAGKYMDVKGFDKACQSCHGRDVTGDRLDEKGLPILGLPAIDTNSLKRHGVNIGQWPDGMEDQELPPVMAYLISENTELAPLLQRLLRGELVLYELEAESADTIRQVGKLAWAIKSLFGALQKSGPASLQKIVDGLHAQQTDSKTQDLLFANMPVDLIRNTQRLWFSRLNSELKAYKAGSSAKTKLIDVNTDTQSDPTAGSWYRNGFSISYRPAGHNDDVLKSWLNLSTVMANNESSPLSAVFSQFAYAKAPGQCIKCHSIDEANEQTRINWQPKKYNPKLQNFTRFEHEAHLSLTDTKGCESCHGINSEAAYTKSFKDRNHLTFQSNFSMMEKDKCAKCHTKEQAGENCLSCHNYHIGNIAPASKSVKNNPETIR